MAKSAEDQLLEDSQTQGSLLIEKFKSDVKGEAIDQLRNNIGNLVSNSETKQYLDAGNAGYSVVGKSIQAFNLYNDLRLAVTLFEQLPDVHSRQAGDAEVGAAREWHDLAKEIEGKAQALNAALSAVSVVLGLFPPTAIAGAGLGILNVVFSELLNMIPALSDIESKAQQAHQKSQQFADLPEDGAVGYFHDEWIALGNSGGGGGETQESGPSPEDGANGDPLILDLDGDGVELIRLGDPVIFFDREQNGVATSTGWVNPDDGFLVRDIDLDNVVDGQAELFGNDTLNAVDDLASYDEDENGQIDAGDTIWQSLRVWRDLNQDGQSSADEMFTMDEIGIVSISLDATDENYVINGNIVDSQTFVTFTDGRTHDALAVLFSVEDALGLDILPEGFVIDPQTNVLPNMPAAGTLSSFAVAMTEDPDLLATMQTLVADATSFTGLEFEAAVEGFLQDWSDIHREDFTDELSYRRAFLSKTLLSDPTTEFAQADAAIDYGYTAYIDSRKLRIAIQLAEQIAIDTPDADPATNPFHAFTHMAFDMETMRVSMTGPDHPFRSVAEAIAQGLSGDVASDATYIQTVAHHFQGIFVDFHNSQEATLSNELSDVLADAISNPFLVELFLDVIAVTESRLGDASDESFDLTHPLFMREFGIDHILVQGGEGDDTFTHIPTDPSEPLPSLQDDTPRIGLVYRDGDGDDTIDLDGGTTIRTRIYLPDFTTEDAYASVDGAGFPKVVFNQGGSVTITGLVSSELNIEIMFADGTVWTKDEVLVATGFATADNLVGTSADETLVGGEGDDTLEGGSGDDTYIFALGDGADQIMEGLRTNFGYDTIVLQDVSLSDLTVSVDGQDAILSSLTSPTDTVRIIDQFDSVGADFSKSVEYVRLSDGALLDADDLIRLRYEQETTAGDDTITGTIRDEIFTLSDGDDLVTLGGGIDKVIRPDGITGDDTVSGKVQEIRLGDDFNQAALVNSTDLLLSFDNGSTLTAVNFFGFTASLVEIILPDQSIITGGEIRILVDGPFDEASFSGTDVTGTAGDDLQTGTTQSNRMLASFGNDTLRGFSGTDVYDWGSGFGDDIIEEQGQIENASTDRVIFSNLNADDVTFTHTSSGDLLVEVIGTSETLTIDQHFTLTSYQIEEFHFADNSITSAAALRLLPIFGTDAGETINGSAASDTIFGLDGNDSVSGRQGDDDIDGGDGADTLRGEDGNDTLQGGSEDDSMFGGNDDDELYGGGGEDTLEGDHGHDMLFGDGGHDMIDGGDGDDTIIGGEGDDVISGEGGSDHYVFAVGDGHDTIEEFDIEAPMEANTIEINGVSFSDLSFQLSLASGYDLKIVYGAGDSIEIEDQFNSFVDRGIFSVTLDDGRVIYAPEMQTLAKVIGTAASETISGPQFSTTYIAGAGDDTIFGNTGDNTFLWGEGDGNDFIQSRAELDAPPEDRVLFVNLASTDVTFSRGDLAVAAEVRDLLITITTTGETLTIDDQFGFHSSFGGREGVSFLEFTDVTLTADQMASLAPIVGTNADDNLSGSSPVDWFEGGLGADTQSGFDGSDVYVWRQGDGNDVIADYGNGGIDILILADVESAGAVLSRDISTGDVLIDITATGETVRIEGPIGNEFFDSNIEKIQFSDDIELDIDDIAATPFVGGSADDLIVGDARGNVMMADQGADTLTGLGGADRYTPAAMGITFVDDEGAYLSSGGGEGEDVASNGGNSGFDIEGASTSGDILDLSAYDLSNVVIRADAAVPDGIAIDLPAGAGTVLIANQAFSAFSGIEVFVFADQTLTGTEIFGLISNGTFTGTAGADTLTGNWLDEIYDPLEGDDLLEIGSGFDQITIGDNSGHDTITGFGGGLIGDKIDLTQSPFADFDALLAASADTVDGVVITLDATSSLTLQGVLVSDLAPENFGFASAGIVGTSDDDTLVGTAFDDPISGAEGNDLIIGGFGNDTMDGGEGHDVFDIRGGFATDSVIGGQGYDQLQISGSHDMIADLSAGTITGGNGLVEFSGIEAVTLGNGDNTAMGSSNDDFISTGKGSDNLTGAAGDDVLSGGEGNDTLEGGAGLDVLAGDEGDDIAVFSGDESDYLYAVSDGEFGTVWDLRSGRPDGADAIVSVETLRFSDQDVLLTLAADGPVLESSTILDEANTTAEITLVLDRDVFWTGSAPLLLVDPATSEEIFRLDPLTDVTISDETITISIPTEVPRTTNLALIIGFGEITDGLGGKFAGIGDPSVIQLVSTDSDLIPLIGTQSADTIIGGEDAEFLEGLAGKDSLNGKGGNDSVLGGEGNDTVRGQDGDDTVEGGLGVDIVRGDNGHDLLFGNDGGDNIGGGLGNDTIDGGAGLDLINAGAGDDVITDLLDGNRLRGDAGDDTITAGDGEDSIRGGDGDDSIIAGGGADDVVGQDDDDWIDLGAGDDTAKGDNGNDYVFGGDGLDRIEGNDGDDTIEGGNDDDRLIGKSGHDILRGQNGDDRLVSGVGDDILEGGDDADFLRAGGGLDTLDGGAGDDTMEGNGGDDTFIIGFGEGVDEISDFEKLGDDVLEFRGFGTDFDEVGEVLAAATQIGGDVLIDFGTGQTLTLAGFTLSELGADDITFG